MENQRSKKSRLISSKRRWKKRSPRFRFNFIDSIRANFMSMDFIYSNERSALLRFCYSKTDRCGNPIMWRLCINRHFGCGLMLLSFHFMAISSVASTFEWVAPPNLHFDHMKNTTSKEEEKNSNDNGFLCSSDKDWIFIFRNITQYDFFYELINVQLLFGWGTTVQNVHGHFSCLGVVVFAPSLLQQLDKIAKLSSFHVY